MLYKQCKTEQSAIRQRELVGGLLEAMLRQHYDEITVSSLCDQMQIPRKSFYRYFSSKEGALDALIDYALMDCEMFTADRLKDRGDVLQQEMTRIFAFWLHRKKLLDALANSGLSGILVQRAIDHARAESSGERKYLPVEEQMSQAYMSLFAVSGLMSMVIQWHHDGYPQSPEKMGQIATRMLTTPMTAMVR